MSFELSGAPAAFQRLMGEVLKSPYNEIPPRVLGRHNCQGQWGISTYRLLSVFDKLRTTNLKLKLDFLDRIFSDQGIATDPKKTDHVQKRPVPRNVHGVSWVWLVLGENKPPAKTNLPCLF